MMMNVNPGKQQAEMTNKQAQAYYARQTDRSLWHRWQQYRTGRSHLPALSAIPARAGLSVQEMFVSVDEIVGSVNPGRAQDFDADFRPRSEHTKVRWLSTAKHLLTGRQLPPVELVGTVQGYYISDGHHRFSVHKALGRAEIVAIVAL